MEGNQKSVDIITMVAKCEHNSTLTHAYCHSAIKPRCQILILFTAILK